MQTYSLLRREGEDETLWIVTCKGELIGSFRTRSQALGAAIGAADAAGKIGGGSEVVVQDDDKCRPQRLWVYGSDICTL
jgi:hypothetical protein